MSDPTLIQHICADCGRVYESVVTEDETTEPCPYCDVD